MNIVDKYCGCLLGGAIGDALGYPIEFYNEYQIHKNFGESGLTDLILIEDKAHVSDDTQMTLFTAEALTIANDLQINVSDVHTYNKYIWNAYKNWYITQMVQYPNNNANTDLMSIPELYHRRAPGNTCMQSIHNDKMGTIAKPINNSKGCGGVMRVAPIGLFYANTTISYDDSDMLGAMASASTHGHSLGYIPSAMLVHIIRKCIETTDNLEDIIVESLDFTKNLFIDDKHIDYFVDLIKKAIYLYKQDINDLEAIHQLGEGWVAEETLAIAIYCALKYSNNFEKAVITAVNHNGDSDSTGSVLGNILGAYLGVSSIPDRFTQNVELSNVICSLAKKLMNKTIRIEK